MKIALTVIIMISLLPIRTPGVIQPSQSLYPLEDVENAIRDSPSWIPRNLFPSISDPIVVWRYDHRSDGKKENKYRFTLQKQSAVSHNQLISRLEPLRESALYKGEFFNGTEPWTFCSFTRAIKLDKTKPPARDNYHVSFGFYQEWNYQGKNTIFFPWYWQDTLKGETLTEIWLEFRVPVNRRGFPIEGSHEYARPIALRTTSAIYLIVLTKSLPDDPDPRQADSYLNEGQFGITHPRTLREEAKRSFEQKVRTSFLQTLSAKFSGAPLYAELDVSLPDELIMVRNYKKNELLNNKYEQSGYVLRVYGEDGIAVFIKYSVLTANHPSNKFYDPTGQEFDRYKQAVKNAQKAAQEETCGAFRGEWRGNVCWIRSR